MKFTITLKDPDRPYEQILETARDSLSEVTGISENEKELLVDGRVEELQEFIGKWFQYGEYIKINFDTEADTATVQRIKK